MLRIYEHAVIISAEAFLCGILLSGINQRN